ncbi:MAG: response regulator transcription factor [Verrucomicrobiota bacterium]
MSPPPEGRPPGSPIRVAIVEDNDEIRGTLERIVGRASGMRFVCGFPNGKTALEMLPQHRPEVVIMDIRLPDVSGIECTAWLKRALPATQVLIFTVYGDNEQVFRALEAGASGYLLKRSTPAEIRQAILEVHRGGAPMTGEIARKVVQSFRKERSETAAAQRLTGREEEVLDLLAQGYVTKEIADKLAVSFDTVRFHLKHIYTKLHVRSRGEAIVQYLR